MGEPAQMVFITRKLCHLCTEALQLVERVRQSVPFELAIVDVDSSPELQDEHGWDVPVLIIDGVRFAKWRVDEEALRARLANGRQASP